MRTSTWDFDDLVRGLYPRVFSFALRLTRNRQDAADVTQDAFVRAYRSGTCADIARKPDSWLLKIAYHCFLDSVKHLKRRPDVTSFEDMGLESGSFDPADSAQNPEEAFFSDKFSEPMTRALAGLSEEQRDLMYLAHFGELSHEEMSQLCGCGANTVKTRIHRTHMTLKRNLASLGCDSAGTRSRSALQRTAAPGNRVQNERV